MRFFLPLLMVFSLNSYAGLRMTGTASAPCIGGIESWESFEYVICPTVTTIAVPLVIILAPTGSTMFIGSSSDKKKQIIIDSKIHAASYVASNGETDSVYLEQALTILREEYPNTLDMELAKAILAY